MNNLSKFVLSIANQAIKLITESGKKISDLEQFKSVVKSEVKAFFYGEEYKDERECIEKKTLDERYIIASLVASVISKTQLN